MPLAGGQILRPSGGAMQQPLPQPPAIRRAVRTSMLPSGASWTSRIAVAAAAGFDGLDVEAVESPVEAEEIAQAAAQYKLAIESVVCTATRRYPLSSADPELQAKGVAALKTALTAAAMWRAEDVVITPAVVDETTPPSAAWSRSQAVLRDQILPLAGGYKVHVAIEVPTDKFILSPADCNRYIDELRSPWIRASLRVCEASGAGIVGTPPEWIRTLARRLTGLRLNDRHLNRAAGTAERRNLGDGDVDWQAVRKAMSEAPFLTWVTADLDGGDGAYISNVRIRVDKFLAGFKPGVGPGA
jgi:L-ribulose-5-phosphate 3-epimerase